MSDSFRRKSAGVSLVVIGALAAYYFARVLDFLRADAQLRAGAAPPDGFVPLVVGTITLIVVVEATLQAVLAIGAGDIPAATAHDREAELRAGRNAYAVLAAGALLAFGSLFWHPSAFVLGNLALLAFVLAELVRLASQVAYARRGAAGTGEAPPSLSEPGAGGSHRRGA